MKREKVRFRTTFFEMALGDIFPKHQSPGHVSLVSYSTPMWVLHPPTCCPHLTPLGAIQSSSRPTWGTHHPGHPCRAPDHRGEAAWGYRLPLLPSGDTRTHRTSLHRIRVHADSLSGCSVARVGHITAQNCLEILLLHLC